MLHYNNYPPIASLRGLRAPIVILEKIICYPNLKKHIIKDTIKLESYKKSLFRDKKVLDVTIQKVPFTDEATRTFDKFSNGKIFGFVVVEDGKETYRALYDMGVFQSCINAIKQHWTEKSIEYLMSDNLAMAQVSSNKSKSNQELQNLHDYIECLFE